MEKGFMDMMKGCQDMAAMCPCFNLKDLSEEEKKALFEKMMSFCGGKMEMMSAFFKKADTSAGSPCCGTGPSEKEKI